MCILPSKRIIQEQESWKGGNSKTAHINMGIAGD
jgi:hypothetical protein